MLIRQKKIITERMNEFLIIFCLNKAEKEEKMAIDIQSQVNSN